MNIIEGSMKILPRTGCLVVVLLLFADSIKVEVSLLDVIAF